MSSQIQLGLQIFYITLVQSTNKRISYCAPVLFSTILRVRFKCCTLSFTLSKREVKSSIEVKTNPILWLLSMTFSLYFISVSFFCLRCKLNPLLCQIASMQNKSSSFLENRHKKGKPFPPPFSLTFSYYLSYIPGASSHPHSSLHKVRPVG